MKNLIKKILIGLSLLVIPIFSYSQHVVNDRTNPKGNSYVGSYNFKYNRVGTKESSDSIYVTSQSILDGDSILMLIGDKPVVITSMSIDYNGTTPYVTSGSTDTTTIYSVNNNTSYPVAYVLDEIYEETSIVTHESGGTYKSDVDSCFYYIKIPSSKFSTGDGEYTLFYDYKILR